MTIDEAIIELTKLVGKWQFSASNERDAALKLGIEALKRLRAYRRNEIGSGKQRLPGETDEKQG